MRIGRLGGAVVALAVMGAGHEALAANTWNVTCPGSGNTTLALNGGATTNFGVDPGALTGSGAGTGAGTTPDALGALLGTPSQGTEAAISGDFAGITLEVGDTVEITGVCQQEILIRESGLTIAGPSGAVTIPQTPPPAGTIVNGIEGQVQVNGAQRITFSDILFGNTTTTVTLPSGYAGAGTALLWVRNGGSAAVQDSVIQNSPVRGAFVSDAGALYFQSSTITENGTGSSDPRFNSGIAAFEGGSLQLGVTSTAGSSTNSYPVDVTDNAGDGIFATRGGAAQIFAATISGNGQKQIRLLESSAGHLSGNNAAQITVSSTNADAAIEADGSSSLLIEAGASITGGASTGATISLNAGSAMLIQGSQVSGGSPTIEASGGSSLYLAGGNLICNGSISGDTCTPGTGAAIEIDHVSALEDVGPAIADFGFPSLGDNIFGAGTVQLQSTADLGAGIVSGSPSITWTTGTSGIVAQQNSSFRLQGGVQINGAVSLSQGSNGFFNHKFNAGGAVNNVSGGVLCPFTSVPSAHVAGANFVSPEPVLSGSVASTTSGQCLNF